MFKPPRIKWHHLYYMLAAFDILAVSGSLYLNHQIMGIYGESVEVNQAWANRLTLLTNLGDLAVEVNAPGNNVFDDGNVELHRQLRDDAHRRYIEKIETIEQDISSIADDELRDNFLSRLSEIDAAMDDMLSEANYIFSLFADQKGSQAGSRMATMDRKAALLLIHISSFTQQILSIQKTNLDEQLNNASNLRQYEYLIAGVIALMVLMVTIYGHKLAVQIRHTQAEREKNHAELKQQARIIEHNERRLSTVINSVSDGILIMDAEGTIEDLNPSAEFHFNYGSEEVLGKNISHLIPKITNLAEVFDTQNEITSGRSTSKLEFVARRQSGEKFHVDIRVNEFEYGGERKFTSIVRDITRFRKYQEKIKTLALQDSLTGLLNRNSFNNYFHQSLDKDQEKGAITALILLDIDRFKTVNDTYGHQVGDKLLVLAAERMKTIFRGNDLIARLGGDEFAIVLGEMESKKQIESLSKRLVERFKEPYVIDNHHIDSGISAGISLSPEDGTEPEELLRRSDMALYSVKDRGRGDYCFYDSSMYNRVVAEKLLEREIQTALHENQFQIHYQPQIDTRDNILFGVEALIRWNHPERGLVAPDQFVFAAEKTTLIIDVGLWVLRQCCEQWFLWQAQNLVPPKIALNISARQLNHPEFLQEVKSLLNQTGMAGENLEFELTETAALADIGDCIDKINAVKALGIQFAVDDFGTGNSSLTYLSQLPLDCVKVDRSFIQDIQQDHTQAVITESLIKLAKRLDIDVIAEGIEDASTARQLAKMGCHIMQGHYYSEPLSAVQYAEWFADWEVLSASNES